MSISQTIVELGLVPEEVLQEHQKWGQRVPTTPIPGDPPPPEEAASRIADAFASEELVEVRETILDLVAYYKRHEESGVLHYHVLPGTENEATGKTPVHFCRWQGQIAIPWSDDVLGNLLLDSRTYLQDVHGGKMYFMSYDNVFHGAVQTFVVARPIMPEPASV
jgi:hypothetical protein